MYIMGKESREVEWYPEPVWQYRRSDKLELRSFWKKLVISPLIEQNHIVHLLLLLSLAPLLLMHLRQTVQKYLNPYSQILKKKIHNQKITTTIKRNEFKTTLESRVQSYLLLLLASARFGGLWGRWRSLFLLWCLQKKHLHYKSTKY